MRIRAWRSWLVLVPAERPGWLELGGRWPPALCVVMALPLTVGLQVLFAYHPTSVGLGVLVEVVLLSLVMARSRAIRWYDVVCLAAILWVAEFIFLVGPARWIWPWSGFSISSLLHVLARPAGIAATSGQVVLALLLLAGLDPQVRRNIRGFITPVGRGFIWRATFATVLVACALWSGRYLLNRDTIVQVRVELATITETYCVRPESAVAPSTQASPPPAPIARCFGPTGAVTDPPR